MKLLYSCSSYLQVDTVIENAEFEIKSTVANKINRLASFFVYISNDKNESHTYLDEYRNKFIEKYGVDREVPLLEMLDSNIGIGAPGLHILIPKMIFSRKILLNLLQFRIKKLFAE